MLKLCGKINKALCVAALCLLAPAHVYAQCAAPNDGLIGHWKLDETSGVTATDSTGSNNGTYTTVDPTTDSVSAQLDTGIDFGASSNGYISLGNDITLLQPNENFSVASWIYFNSFPANYNTVYSAGDTANSYWFLAADWGGTPSFGLVIDGGSFDSANTIISAISG